MNWAQAIIASLKAQAISMIAFVPDVSIDKVTRLMEKDPFFTVVAATREEEAIGIASGAYAVGRNAAVFMQSSGFGNSVNAIASLCMPCRIPIPMFINLRGQLGEFNIAQVAMGQATRPILDVLGLPHYILNASDDIEKVTTGALQLCYGSRQPLAICLTPLLTGGKLV